MSNTIQFRMIGNLTGFPNSIFRPEFSDILPKFDTSVLICCSVIAFSSVLIFVWVYYYSSFRLNISCILYNEYTHSAQSFFADIVLLKQVCFVSHSFELQIVAAVVLEEHRPLFTLHFTFYFLLKLVPIIYI
jgi:hypothetical protein